MSGSLEIGVKLEPVIDRRWIERLEGAELRLERPEMREVALAFDQPWEQAAGYVTVLKDGPIYRMYYRGYGPAADGGPDPTADVTCYAESRDGVRWEKPELGLHAWGGSKRNNIVLAPDPGRRISHNFAPFIDTRPGVPADERFKAVGGVYEDDPERAGDRAWRATHGGLYRLASADGVRWRRWAEEPIFVGYALDSQNCALWSEADAGYVIYLRTWSEGGTPERPDYAGFRTVSRSFSKDFARWSKPAPMDCGDGPMEHLYTNGLHPYFRAPHVNVGLAFRLLPERRVLSEERLRAHGVPAGQWRGVSDAVLLSTRGGDRLDRTFRESFIRPGPDGRAWHARNNAPALGVVPTGDGEMSAYLVRHYMLPTAHLRRYALRTDGFASIAAGAAGGEAWTRPLTFDGRRLTLNFATSAAGDVRVGLVEADGRSVPGFGLDECDALVGDEVAGPVTWRGEADLGRWRGRAVRLRFRLRDANVFALQFLP